MVKMKEQPVAGGKSILIMEDSEVVRRSMADGLLEIGYEIEFANDVSETIQKYQ